MSLSIDQKTIVHEMNYSSSAWKQKPQWILKVGAPLIPNKVGPYLTWTMITNDANHEPMWKIYNMSLGIVSTHVWVQCGSTKSGNREEVIAPCWRWPLWVRYNSCWILLRVESENVWGDFGAHLVYFKKVGWGGLWFEINIELSLSLGEGGKPMHEAMGMVECGSILYTMHLT